MRNLSNWKVWVYWILAFVAVALFATGSQITRLTFGPVSISALMTTTVSISLIAIALILFFAQWRTLGINVLAKTHPRALIYFIPIVIFLTYVAFSLLLNPTTQGFQNLLSMCLFGIGLIVFSFLSNQDLRKLTYIGIYWGSALFASVSLVFFLFGSSYIDARAFAMTAVVGLAAIIPLTNGNNFAKIVPVLIFVTILFSASRIATFSALIVIGFIGCNFNASKIKNIFIMLVSYFFASFITVFAYLFVPSTKERVEAGDQGLVINPGASLGGGGGDSNGASNAISTPIVINTNGRVDAWREFLDTVKTPEDILWGQGTGATASYGQKHLPYFPQVLNEYLRVFLDNGVIGLILFLTVFITLLIAILKPLKAVGPYQMSGFLVLLASSVVAITDGQFIYPFTALTSGLIVGLALMERAHFISPLPELTR